MNDPLDMMDTPAQVTRDFILCYLCSPDAPKLNCDVCYGRGKMIKVPHTDDIYPRFMVTITSRLSGTITCRGVIGHSELDTGPLFSVMYSDGATESWPIALLSGIKVHPNAHGEQKVKHDEPQPASRADLMAKAEAWAAKPKPEQEIQADEAAADEEKEAIRAEFKKQLDEILRESEPGGH